MSLDGYDYSSYDSFCLEASRNDVAFQTFKSNPKYMEILEHVSQAQGLEYLKLLWEEFRLGENDIVDFCKKNDLLGSPIKHRYSDILICSPTSIRYIYHANLILSWMKQLDTKNIKIVELGCGYGGLCLAIQHFAKRYGVDIERYALIDLANASQLQKRYLVEYSQNTFLEFHSAEDHGKTLDGTDWFFISNYCFSEISSENQRKYIENLLPKCQHGFLAWNMIDLYEFGKPILNHQPERPLTGSKNRFVFF